MPEAFYEVVINAAQARYLKGLSESTAVISKQVDSRTGATTVLRLSEDARSALMDRVGSRLQRRGFNADYSLTEEGEILESLIDVLSTAVRTE